MSTRIYLSNKCSVSYHNILFPQSSPSLSHEYVIYVDKDIPLQTHAKLPVAQVRQGIQEQQFVQPEPESSPEQDPLDAIIHTVVLFKTNTLSEITAENEDGNRWHLPAEH